MPQHRYEWPHVGGLVVTWLVVAVIAGAGLFALFDPGAIEPLVTAGL